MATVHLLKLTKREKKNGNGRGERSSTENSDLFREIMPSSFYNCRRSYRQQSSRQEGKLLYAERASRGYRI